MAAPAPVRPLAPHVSAAVGGAAQPKRPATAPPPARPVAPHVAAAQRAVQPKAPQPPLPAPPRAAVPAPSPKAPVAAVSRPVAPHVAAAAGGVQLKKAEAAPSRAPAPPSRPAMMGPAAPRAVHRQTRPAVVQGVLWTWAGMKWVPDRQTRAQGPRYPGEFIGQTFDDMSGERGGRPFVLSQMEQIRRPLRISFRTGLARGGAMRRFVGSVNEIANDPGALTFQDVGSRLSQAANFELNRVGGPSIGFSVPVHTTRESGSFSESRWALSLTEPQEATSFSELSDIVYHETRHAEQFFRVARLLAGFGLDSRQIARETGIPRRIARSAALVPLRLPPSGWTPETLEATRWYHAFFGEGSGHRFTTLWRHQRPSKDLLLALANLKAMKATYDGFKMLANSLKTEALFFNSEIQMLNLQIQQLRQGGDETQGELAQALLELEQKTTERDDAIQEYQQHLEAANRAAAAYRSLAEDIPALKRRAEEAELYYEDYRALPEEEDAWAVGTEIASLTRKY